MTRNVVLLCLDTVRKDAFDKYAPRLSALSDVSVQQCRSASSWSLPSHASMFSGQLPHQHGISAKGHQTYAELPLDATFLSSLPDHARLGVSENTFASEDFEFDHLFDEFVTYSDSKLLQRARSVEKVADPTIESPIERYGRFVSDSLRGERPLQTLINGVFPRIESRRTGAIASSFVNGYHWQDEARSQSAVASQLVRDTEDPYFLFVNYMSAHSPFEDRPQFADAPFDVPDGWHSSDLPTEARLSTEPVDAHHYRHAYANSVTYLDRALDEFIRTLLSTGDRETTVVLTADHGEALGYAAEDHLVGHNNLSEGTTHVPLEIINPPFGAPATVDHYVSHLDLGALLVDIANGEWDLTPHCTPVVAETPRVGGLKKSAHEDRPLFNRAVRSLWEDESLYVWDSLGKCEVFEIDFDEPSSQSRTGDCESLPSGADDAFDCSINDIATSPRTDGIDADQATKDRLQKLGYLD